MIAIAPTAAALLFGAAGGYLRLVDDRRHARRVATSCAAIALVLTAVALPFARLSLPFAVLPAGALELAPLVAAATLLIAVGLAPLASHPPKTLARCSFLIAGAQAYLAVPHPIILCLLWVGSSFLVYGELCTKRDGTERVFLVYHGLSALAFVTGSALLTRAPTPAVALMLFGVVVREGLLPLQSWFPRFVERAPLAIVVTFTGPQLGMYAQLELLGHHALGGFTQSLAWLGGATALLAAMLGLVQRDARRALAYLILSQAGLIELGLAGGSVVGLFGAILNWQVLALSTSALLMALAALEARRGPQALDRPHGHYGSTPRLAIAFLFLGFASVGFPLTLGFIAEDLMIQGALTNLPGCGLLLMVATAFNSMAVARAFFYLFMGERTGNGAGDLGRRELLIFSLVMALLLLIGTVPGPALEKVFDGGLAWQRWLT